MDIQQLTALTQTFNNVQMVCCEILRKALPILGDLEEKNNELVHDIQEDLPEVDKGMILEKLRCEALDMTKDAEITFAEIDSFSSNLVQGEDTLEEGWESYPFLMQVWRGDIYDESGLDALLLLYEDLGRQCDDIDDDTLIENVIQQLKPIASSSAPEEN